MCGGEKQAEEERSAILSEIRGDYHQREVVVEEEAEAEVEEEEVEEEEGSVLALPAKIITPRKNR